MAFFKMCPADNLQDATDWGGLITSKVRYVHKTTGCGEDDYKTDVIQFHQKNIVDCRQKGPKSCDLHLNRTPPPLKP